MSAQFEEKNQKKRKKRKNREIKKKKKQISIAIEKWIFCQYKKKTEIFFRQ